MSQLGQIIHMRRRELRMTQAALAKAAGTVNTHICQIETGKSLPSVPLLEAISEALQLPANSLIGHVEKPKAPGLVELRDYLAAKALPNIYSTAMVDAADGSGLFSDPDWRIGLALDAYAMADAMLVARSKSQAPGAAPGAVE